VPTLIEDPAAVFPQCPTYGFTPEPSYLVKIISREGGYERRQRVWSRPISKYSAVPLGDQPQADIENVLYFWHAMGGMSTAFRFLDQIDYMSCRLNAEPAVTDQPIEANPDSPSRYILTKQYTFGAYTQVREILRPIGSTIMIANEEGTPQEDWTLDTTCGLVTPGETFSGIPSFWGGMFHVWVRFDAQFAPQISNFKIISANIQLQEIRMPLP
jgi:uncharacterized protein (TIGR02217 family)